MVLPASQARGACFLYHGVLFGERRCVCLWACMVFFFACVACVRGCKVEPLKGFIYVRFCGCCSDVFFCQRAGIGACFAAFAGVICNSLLVKLHIYTKETKYSELFFFRKNKKSTVRTVYLGLAHGVVLNLEQSYICACFLPYQASLKGPDRWPGLGLELYRLGANALSVAIKRAVYESRVNGLTRLLGRGCEETLCPCFYGYPGQGRKVSEQLCSKVWEAICARDKTLYNSLNMP